MSKPKTSASALAIAVCAALCLLSGFFALYFSTTDAQKYVSAFSAGNVDTGEFKLKVLNGLTKQPVAKAAVVLPQTGKTYQTGADGQTEDIRVPIFTDTLLGDIKKQDWGSVCVLVYADGYIPYALFDMQVEANKKRLGPTILLFPEGSTQSDDPLSIVEAPQRAWVNALVQQYRPKQAD